MPKPDDERRPNREPRGGPSVAAWTAMGVWVALLVTAFLLPERLARPMRLVVTVLGIGVGIFFRPPWPRVRGKIGDCLTVPFPSLSPVPFLLPMKLSRRTSVPHTPAINCPRHINHSTDEHPLKHCKRDERSWRRRHSGIKPEERVPRKRKAVDEILGFFGLVGHAVRE